MTVSSLVFGLLVAVAFVGFYFSVPDGPGTPRKTITNISALFMGAVAIGTAAGMFWALLDVPIVWP